MSKIANQAKAAKDTLTKRMFARLFKKPAGSVDPASPQSTHRTIAIIATGGTFLCSSKITPRKPQYHKNLAEFIAASKLTSYFQTLGVYQKGDQYFLPDGTEIVYKPLDPSIDSTNARYKERHTIATVIRELQDNYTQVDALVIHGTDTAAQTAQFLDLQFGREADIGIAIVTSQDPADATDTDAHGQFKTGFRALHERKFRHVFVPSNNGTEIFSGIAAKITDIWSAIYTGNLIGRADRSVITRLVNFATGSGRPERIKIPSLAAFGKAIIKDHTPQGDGEQEIQAENTADEIRANRKGEERKRYNAVVLHTAGSGNFPDYADDILKAAANELPVFALSEVPGAVTVDEHGVAKYAASVVEKARELKLNNLIVLPATRSGLEMRPSSLLALAATYAEPRTPEFLFLCHVFSSFAWTPEDEDGKSLQIKGNRQDLIDLRETLDEVYTTLFATPVVEAHNKGQFDGPWDRPDKKLADTPYIDAHVYNGGDIQIPPYNRHSGEGKHLSLKGKEKIPAGEYLYDPAKKILIDPKSFDHRASLAFKNARLSRLFKKYVPHLVDVDGHYQLQDTYNADGNVITGRMLKVNPSYYGNVVPINKRSRPVSKRKKSDQRLTA